MLTRKTMLTMLRVVARTGALTHPDRARTQHAPQLASARQVGPVA
jgi:hypothetical protein